MCTESREEGATSCANENVEHHIDNSSTEIATPAKHPTCKPTVLRRADTNIIGCMKNLGKNDATKLKKRKHASFSEEDNVIYPCSELYHPFVDQYDSRRYDLNHSRCPPNGSYPLDWGTLSRDRDVAIAVAIRKASFMGFEVWRENSTPKCGKCHGLVYKVPVLWHADNSCSVYEFWTPFSSRVEFCRAFRRSDMTPEELHGQSSTQTLAIMACYSGGVQDGKPELKKPYCEIDNENVPSLKTIARIRRQWQEENTDEQLQLKAKREKAKSKLGSSSKGNKAAAAVPNQPWETIDPNDCSYCLIEYCCDYESNLCNDKFSDHDGRKVALVRLTMREDMTAQTGLDYAMSAVNKFKGKCDIFVWASLPCTGGTHFQKVNQYLYANHWVNMAEHDRKFKAFHSNLMKLLAALPPQNVYFAFEWPEPNDWWDREEIKSMIETLNLKTLLFNGCMLGLKAFDTLKPHKKAWRVEHCIPSLHPFLCDKVCCHKPWEHEVIRGKYTKATGTYPMPMCEIIHQAFRETISE